MWNNKIKINVGQRFGRLTVVSEAPKVLTASGEERRAFFCRCDCGAEVTTRLKYLRNGGVASCGCYRDEVRIATKTKHGMTASTEYSIWCDMRKRCQNHKHVHFDRYGGRGIAVCTRWQDFENFYKDMGSRPPNKSLDRIDNNGNYAPSNCRWATAEEQAQNKSTTTLVSVDGENRKLVDLAKAYGIHARTLRTRLARGWSVDRALSDPVRISAGVYKQLVWPV